MVWKPALNATVHWVWSVKWDNTGGRWTRGEEGSVVVTGLEVEQDYWFSVIAGREIPGQPTQWSKWSNWAKATPKEQEFTIELVCINVVRKPCQELAATDSAPGLGGLPTVGDLVGDSRSRLLMVRSGDMGREYLNRRSGIL